MKLKYKPVTKRAVTQRVARAIDGKLEADRSTPGRYYIVGDGLEAIDDIEKLARKLGVLRDHERMEG